VVSFTFVVVASCWSSSGDVESRVLLLLHARTHLKHKKKKLHLLREVEEEAVSKDVEKQQKKEKKKRKKKE
jgi:hypothetical protein